MDVKRRQAPSDAADQRLGGLVKRAEQAMLRAKTALLKPIGLTLAQYVALVELEQQPGITAASLSRACLVSPQAMMILLKTMEQQGLIQRTPHPRHANVLELHATDAGREALHEARKRITPLEKRVLASYSARELETFRALLSRFAEAFEAK
jgi:DNA-binding MarR family transcriptional regulator